MRRKIIGVFVAFLALAVLTIGSGPSAAAAPQQVTLLHVNDTHSHLEAWGPKDAALDGTLGGLPKAAARRSSSRRAVTTGMSNACGCRWTGPR